MFPLWFGGSFVFLDMGPSILFLVFPFLGALVNLLLVEFSHLKALISIHPTLVVMQLWLIYGW